MSVRELFFGRRTIRRTVVKNVFWLFASQIVGRLIKAAIIVYAARALGAAQYGIFSLAQSLAGLLWLFSDIGVNAVIVREVARDSHSKGRWIATGLFLKIVLLLVSLVATLLFAFGFAKIGAPGILLPLVSLVFFLDGMRDFGFAIVRATEQMQWEAFASFLGNLVTVVAGIAFLTVWKSPVHLALGYLLGSACGALVIFLAIRSYLHGIVRNIDLSLSRFLIGTAWPFVIWAMLSSVLIYTDAIMLGLLKGPGVVGIYSAAARPIQLLFVLPELLAIGIFPTLVRRADHGDFLTPLARCVGASVLAALPLTIGGIILAKPIILVLFGAAYRESVPVFQILLIILLLQFPGVLIGNAIFARDRHVEMIRYIVAAAGANVLLNWLLIPGYGAAGSAAATVLSRGILLLGMLSIQMRIQAFKILGLMWRGLLAALVMALGLALISYADMNLWISIGIGGVLYLAALRMLKEPLLDEISGLLRA